MNYRHYIRNLPAELLNIHGEGINIGILDSGINNHHDLDGAIASHYNYTNSAHGSIDVLGHGTHIAGLIAGRGTSNTGIVGLADNSIIHNIKVVRDDNSTNGIDVLRGLELILNNPAIEIVNLSLSVSKSEKNQLINIISTLVSHGKIIVCSAGNNEKLRSGRELLTPADMPGVISVGAINRDYLLNNPNFIFNSQLDYLFTQEQLISCGNNNDYVEKYGSSQSAALLTGIIALIKSRFPFFTLHEIQNYISGFAIPRRDYNAEHQFSLIKII